MHFYGNLSLLWKIRKFAQIETLGYKILPFFFKLLGVIPDHATRPFKAKQQVSVSEVYTFISELSKLCRLLSNMFILVLLCFVFISICLLFCFVFLFLLVCWSVGFLEPHNVLLVEENAFISRWLGCNKDPSHRITVQLLS